MFFMLFAALWHVPLLILPQGKQSDPKIRPSLHESPSVVMQTEVQIADRSFWSDPTVYLLPNDVGFSTYRRRVANPSLSTMQDSRADVVAENSDDESQRGLSIDHALRLAQSSFMEVSARDLKTVSFVEDSESQKSSWHIVGAVADRLLPNNSELPIVVSSDPLQPTTLRIAVNERGEVAFALLDHSSGSDKADEAGIRFVRNLRFVPIDSTLQESTHSWGFLKIDWRGDR
jgi:hypothetical protein